MCVLLTLPPNRPGFGPGMRFASCFAVVLLFLPQRFGTSASGGSGPDCNPNPNPNPNLDPNPDPKRDPDPDPDANYLIS